MRFQINLLSNFIWLHKMTTCKISWMRKCNQEHYYSIIIRIKLLSITLLLKRNVCQLHFESRNLPPNCRHKPSITRSCAERFCKFFWTLFSILYLCFAFQLYNPQWRLAFPILSRSNFSKLEFIVLLKPTWVLKKFANFMQNYSVIFGSSIG